MAETTDQSVLVVFQVGGENCAIPAGSVSEIAPMARLARSPGLPSVLAGLLNLRGVAVPVIRLDRLFGLPPRDPGAYSHLIVLRGPSGPAAILADRVLDVASPPAEAFRPVPPGKSFNACAVSLVEMDGRSIYLLSADRLLLEQEKQAVDEFRSLSQRYLDDLLARPGA